MIPTIDISASFEEQFDHIRLVPRIAAPLRAAFRVSGSGFPPLLTKASTMLMTPLAAASFTGDIYVCPQR